MEEEEEEEGEGEGGVRSFIAGEKFFVVRGMCDESEGI